MSKYTFQINTKKDYEKIILGAAVAFAAILGANTASQTSEMAMSDLQMENVEALGWSLSEWWNRLDYVCKPEECKVDYAYFTGKSKGVEEGTGEVAHSWNCNCDVMFAASYGSYVNTYNHIY